VTSRTLKRASSSSQSPSTLKRCPSSAVDKAHVAASQWLTEGFPAARLSVLPHAQACADSFSHINSFSLIFGGSSSFFLLFFQFLEREKAFLDRETQSKSVRSGFFPRFVETS